MKKSIYIVSLSLTVSSSFAMDYLSLDKKDTKNVVTMNFGDPLNESIDVITEDANKIRLFLKGLAKKKEVAILLPLVQSEALAMPMSGFEQSKSILYVLAEFAQEQHANLKFFFEEFIAAEAKLKYINNVYNVCKRLAKDRDDRTVLSLISSLSNAVGKPSFKDMADQVDTFVNRVKTFESQIDAATIWCLEEVLRKILETKNTLKSFAEGVECFPTLASLARVNRPTPKVRDELSCFLKIADKRKELIAIMRLALMLKNYDTVVLVNASKHHVLYSVKRYLQALNYTTAFSAGSMKLADDSITAHFGEAQAFKKISVSRLEMHFQTALSKINEVQDQTQKYKKQLNEYACNVCEKLTRNKCSVCKARFYCSVDCQKKDWPYHKDYCKAMSTNIDGVKK